ncbi:MAG: DNA primase [Clostridiales bacterium]|nr:DNA primase [Clostridiales bacterium]
MPPPDYENDPEWEKRKSIRDRLVAANTEAARFYHANLWETGGKKALDYLHGRGINDSTIRKFGLGYSPDQFDSLLNHLTGKGYTVDELALAGLCVKKESNAYDMFRNRVMFPIISAAGQVIGFGGRVMGDIKPKYLNTSDTPVFNKRLGVYAANLIKKERNLKRILLTEGYMDVISLYQNGITGAVATLGTSLTLEQARLIHRYCSDIRILYDGDEPGQHAIERAVEIFASDGIPVKVLQLPEGMDPDEYVRGFGADAFAKLRPLSSTRFLMQRRAKELDLDTEDGRTECARKCAELLKNVSEPVELENDINYLHDITGFSKEVLYAQVKAGNSGKTDDPLHYEEQKPRNVVKQFDNFDAERRKKSFKAEQTILCLFAHRQIPDTVIGKDDFCVGLFARVFEDLKNNPALTIPVILENVQSEEEKRVLSETFSADCSPEQTDPVKLASDCVNTIRREKINRQIDELKEELRETSDEDRKKVILSSIMQLSKEAGAYRAKAGGQDSERG